ncbi:hypothetical protein M427DRAFT_149836 [Gonapodya prolifera JEL478]|uniref:PH domain-containing protein n=1 Tax=Gonapodya prolifera (strain JEL478) TaxID=1344416 RepID=A0A138ZY49_GONPJ|nr:hypothetical protein M427DRAFT_149836 [Gonapodya prolifera JEL478]|eukprot:KXS09426.1 hypothetical protein M427DRAFT_149836 [Gonapodya prolifera JEL478]
MHGTVQRKTSVFPLSRNIGEFLKKALEKRHAKKLTLYRRKMSQLDAYLHARSRRGPQIDASPASPTSPVSPTSLSSTSAPRPHPATIAQVVARAQASVPGQLSSTVSARLSLSRSESNLAGTSPALSSQPKGGMSNVVSTPAGRAAAIAAATAAAVSTSRMHHSRSQTSSGESNSVTPTTPRRKPATMPTQNDMSHSISSGGTARMPVASLPGTTYTAPVSWTNHISTPNPPSQAISPAPISTPHSAYTSAAPSAVLSPVSSKALAPDGEEENDSDEGVDRRPPVSLPHIIPPMRFLAPPRHASSLSLALRAAGDEDDDVDYDEEGVEESDEYDEEEYEEEKMMAEEKLKGKQHTSSARPTRIPAGPPPAPNVHPATRRTPSAPTTAVASPSPMVATASGVLSSSRGSVGPPAPTSVKTPLVGMTGAGGMGLGMVGGSATLDEIAKSGYLWKKGSLNKWKQVWAVARTRDTKAGVLCLHKTPNDPFPYKTLDMSAVSSCTSHHPPNPSLLHLPTTPPSVRFEILLTFHRPSSSAASASALGLVAPGWVLAAATLQDRDAWVHALDSLIPRAAGGAVERIQREREQAERDRERAEEEALRMRREVERVEREWKERESKLGRVAAASQPRQTMAPPSTAPSVAVVAQGVKSVEAATTAARCAVEDLRGRCEAGMDEQRSSLTETKCAVEKARDAAEKAASGSARMVEVVTAVGRSVEAVRLAQEKTMQKIASQASLVPPAVNLQPIEDAVREAQHQLDRRMFQVRTMVGDVAEAVAGIGEQIAGEKIVAEIREAGERMGVRVDEAAAKMERAAADATSKAYDNTEDLKKSIAKLGSDVGHRLGQIQTAVAIVSEIASKRRALEIGEDDRVVTTERHVETTQMAIESLRNDIEAGFKDVKASQRAAALFMGRNDNLRSQKDLPIESNDCFSQELKDEMAAVRREVRSLSNLREDVIGLHRDVAPIREVKDVMTAARSEMKQVVEATTTASNNVNAVREQTQSIATDLHTQIERCNNGVYERIDTVRDDVRAVKRDVKESIRASTVEVASGLVDAVKPVRDVAFETKRAVLEVAERVEAADEKLTRMAAQLQTSAVAARFEDISTVLTGISDNMKGRTESEELMHAKLDNIIEVSGFLHETQCRLLKAASSPKKHAKKLPEDDDPVLEAIEKSREDISARVIGGIQAEIAKLGPITPTTQSSPLKGGTLVRVLTQTDLHKGLQLDRDALREVVEDAVATTILTQQKTIGVGERAALALINDRLGKMVQLWEECSLKSDAPGMIDSAPAGTTLPAPQSPSRGVSDRFAGEVTQRLSDIDHRLVRLTKEDQLNHDILAGWLKQIVDNLRGLRKEVTDLGAIERARDLRSPSGDMVLATADGEQIALQWGSIGGKIERQIEGLQKAVEKGFAKELRVAKSSAQELDKASSASFDDVTRALLDLQKSISNINQDRDTDLIRTTIRDAITEESVKMDANIKSSLSQVGDRVASLQRSLENSPSVVLALGELQEEVRSAVSKQEITSNSHMQGIETKMKQLHGEMKALAAKVPVAPVKLDSAVVLNPVEPLVAELRDHIATVKNVPEQSANVTVTAITSLLENLKDQLRAEFLLHSGSQPSQHNSNEVLDQINRTVTRLSFASGEHHKSVESIIRGVYDDVKEVLQAHEQRLETFKEHIGAKVEPSANNGPTKLERDISEIKEMLYSLGEREATRAGRESESPRTLCSDPPDEKVDVDITVKHAEVQKLQEVINALDERRALLFEEVDSLLGSKRLLQDQVSTLEARTIQLNNEIKAAKRAQSEKRRSVDAEAQREVRSLVEEAMKLESDVKERTRLLVGDMARLQDQKRKLAAEVDRLRKEKEEMDGGVILPGWSRTYSGLGRAASVASMGSVVERVVAGLYDGKESPLGLSGASTKRSEAFFTPTVASPGSPTNRPESPAEPAESIPGSLGASTVGDKSPRRPGGGSPLRKISQSLRKKAGELMVASAGVIGTEEHVEVVEKVIPSASSFFGLWKTTLPTT